MSTRRGARHDPIRTVTLRDGRKRYRFVIDLDRGPNGKRVQRTYTFDTKAEAKAERARIITSVSDGTHVRRDMRTTFSQVAEVWLTSKRREVREVTALTYTGVLGHAVRAFGEVPVQRVTRRHVEAMAEAMTAAGLSGRTVGLCLTLVRAVLAQAVDDQQVTRNVAANVRAPEHQSRARTSFTPAEVVRLAATAKDERLYACWLLTLSGLRRSEVLGLTWVAVDLDGGMLDISQARVRVAHDRTVVGAPKTQRGRRTLPLTPDMTAALKSLRTQQARERMALGPAYRDSGFVAVDEAGKPLRPEAYSDAWRDLCGTAGVRPLTLHEARHSSVTAMRDRGVPDHVVAAWHGHDEAVMRRTYSHALADPMAAAAKALAEVRSGAV